MDNHKMVGMDNLAKHGGGGGGGKKKGKGEKKAFSGNKYSDVKEVYVSRNGMPRKGNTVKVKVHEFEFREDAMEVFKKKVAMLFDVEEEYPEGVAVFYSDSGVPLKELSTIRHEDIMYCAFVFEKFYGSTNKAEIEAKEAREQAEREEAERIREERIQALKEEYEAKKALAMAKEKRQLANPEINPDSEKLAIPEDIERISALGPVTIAAEKEGEARGNKRDLLQLYGGEEHLTYSEMLMETRPAKAPRMMLPAQPSAEEIEERERVREAKKMEREADHSVGTEHLERQGLTTSATEALTQLREFALQHKKEEEAKLAALDRVIEKPEVELEKREDLEEMMDLAGTMTKVGIVTSVEPEGEAKALSKRELRNVDFAKRKKAEKKKRRAQKKREEAPKRVAAAYELEEEVVGPVFVPGGGSDSSSEDEGPVVGPPRPT